MASLEMYTRKKTHRRRGEGKGFGGTSHNCLATTPLLLLRRISWDDRLHEGGLHVLETWERMLSATLVFAMHGIGIAALGAVCLVHAICAWRIVIDRCFFDKRTCCEVNRESVTGA